MTDTRQLSVNSKEAGVGMRKAGVANPEERGFLCLERQKSLLTLTR